MKAKMILIALGALAMVFVVAQIVVAKNSNDTLSYRYKVVENLGEIEIREYSEATFARVSVDSRSFKEMSYGGFRVLAGYIFGGNDEGKKISMTSPVIMEMNQSKTMEFMMPYNYNQTNLPIPNDKSIEFYEKPKWKAAAITFGGYADDKKINEYKNELFQQLDKLGFKYNEDFKYMGYNPPYQLVKRKNEIVVELL